MTTDKKLDLILSKIENIESDVSSLKSDMQNVKQDIQYLKKQGAETFEELMKVEKTVIKNSDNIKDLQSKYNTLLLTSDNTVLFLKLINQQTEEVTSLKSRVDRLERQLA